VRNHRPQFLRSRRQRSGLQFIRVQLESRDQLLGHAEGDLKFVRFDRQRASSSEEGVLSDRIVTVILSVPDEHLCQSRLFGGTLCRRELRLEDVSHLLVRRTPRLGVGDGQPQRSVIVSHRPSGEQSDADEAHPTQHGNPKTERSTIPASA